MKSIPFTPLEPGTYREIVRRALAEDLGWGDVTTEGTVAPQQRATVVRLQRFPSEQPDFGTKNKACAFARTDGFGASTRGTLSFPTSQRR